MKKVNKKTLLILALLLLIAPVLFMLPTSAAELNNRNITISSANANASDQFYQISFRPSTATTLASMRFEFCSNSPLSIDPCVAPSGLNLNSSTGSLTAQSGNTGFDFVFVGSNSNTIIFNRTADAASLTQSSYTLGGITNPASTNDSVFVRISLHSSSDGTGPAFDEGAVAFAMTPAFSIGVYVPPYITLCVAQTVAVNCSNAVGNLIDFGEFNSLAATTATTQFSVATNDPTGYNTFINGQTMTSGSNIIPPLTSQTNSVVGTSQFGFNLRANSSPSVGANTDGGGTGSPNATYNTPNQFKFVNGDLIASSPISTDFTRYTVSYLVNVAQQQPPGIYASTLTFTSVASF